MGTTLSVRVVVMGVSGAGKSTVGRLLASALGAPYVEGDDLHPPENVAKMAAGVALDDIDRLPWLEFVGAALGADPVVVSCSALKRSYRDLLRSAAPDAFFVHLDGSADLLRQRQVARSGHFMPESLMDTQLAALEPLEPDERGMALDVAAGPDEVVRRALAAIA